MKRLPNVLLERRFGRPAILLSFLFLWLAGWVASPRALAAAHIDSVSAPAVNEDVVARPTFRAYDDADLGWVFSSVTVTGPAQSIAVSRVGLTITAAITQPPNFNGTRTFTINYVYDAGIFGSRTATASFDQTWNAVNDAPSIAAVADQTGSEDTTKDVSVTLADIDTAIGSLSLSGASSNTGLVPSANISFIGTGATRTVRVVPAPHAHGTTTITLTPNDGSLNGSPVSFSLNFAAVNDIPVAGTPTVLALDGTNDRAEVEAIDLSNRSFSVEFWAKHDRSNVQDWLVTQGSAAVTHSTLHIGFRANNKFSFAFWGNDLDTPAAYADTAWHHWACTYDATANARSIYRDGILVASDTPVAGYGGSGRIYFGYSQPLNSYSAGEMDDVRLWLAALTPAQIQSRMQTALRGDETDLEANWRFDEGSNTMAFDSATLDGRQNAVLLNGAGFAQRRDDTGLVFDGSNDQFAVAHDAALNAYPLTASVWVKTTDTAGGIIGKYVSGSLNGWEVYLNGGNLRAWYFKDANNYVWDGGSGIDGGSISDGRWHHVAFVVNSTGGSLYVDGALRNSLPWSAPGGAAPVPGPATSTANLVIGNYVGAVEGFLLGRVDEATVWSRALTVDEVRTGMNRTYAGNENGLVAYYPTSEGSGNTVANAVGPVRTGNLTGGVAWGLADNATGGYGTVVANEETPTPVYLSGTDVELFRGEGTPSLTYAVVDHPTHGILGNGVGTSPAAVTGDWSQAARNPITYTPANAYNGPDAFSFRLTDNLSGVSKLHLVRIVVAALNDAPLMTLVPDQQILQDTTTGPLAFDVTDQDHASSLVTVTARSLDTRLVPASGIALAGTDVARTITVTPAVGEIGTVTIELTATDPAFGTSVRTFRLRVDPKPAYALVDLGDIGVRNRSTGHAVNDSGWAVGKVFSQQGDRHGFLYRGLGGSAGMEDLGTLGGSGTVSEAVAIDSLNRIVGTATATAGGSTAAFLWKDGVMTSLAPALASSGNASLGAAINEAGDIAGSIAVLSPVGALRAFRLPNGAPVQILGPAAGGATSQGFGMNAAGIVVGYSAPAAGAELAVEWSGTTASLLGTGKPGGHYSARAYAINDSGIIVGSSLTANDAATGRRRAFQFANGAFTDLGTLDGGLSAEAYSINAFGQVAGTATRSAVQVAFLRSAGSNYDLNDLIHDSRSLVFDPSRWKLSEARSISGNGTIVGLGTLDGKQHAFMAVPAWVIGRPIARPEGTVERYPEISIISGNSDDTPSSAFFWSDFEKRLYPIRPVTARIRWFTSFNDTVGTGADIQANTERVETIGISVWPKDPTIHVAESPVGLEPKGVGFAYGFQTILYTTTGGAAHVDITSKTFGCEKTGYSVLYYLRTEGQAPSPSTQRPFFDVVRTVLWDDPKHLQDRTAVVGVKLVDPPVGEDPGHQEYGRRNGWIHFPNAFYDGAGNDRAYDRATRLGTITPVNVDTTSLEDDLVVVWYRFNRIGVAWSGRPVRYTVGWPDDATVAKIVIASQQGSGPLPAQEYVTPRVYNQPDPAFPGYNPNEEHALIAPSNGGSGNALFALRNDLNADVKPMASLPYAILKYRDPATGDWDHKIYKVIGEDDTYKFRYEGVAGNEIQPPYPLSLLQPLSSSSHGVEGPWWEDFKGRMYARAAGPEGSDTNIVIRWFYPLQPDFFYDLDRSGAADAAPGTEIAWLDHHTSGDLSSPNDQNGVSGTPIDVTYATRWKKVGILQVGETLMKSKNGLPAVKNMAKVETIYDDLNPDWNPLAPDAETPVDGLTRLYDPLSTRVLALEPGQSIPDSIARQNVSGKEIFTKLPPTLIDRLKYDPINRWLLFSGSLDETVAGEPLLLPNVLSSRERDRLKELAPGVTAWGELMDQLYDLSRNPNRVDLDEDGVVDKALRVGLVTQYTYEYNVSETVTTDGATASSVAHFVVKTTHLPNAAEKAQLEGFEVTDTNVVIEALGALPKALTAAIGGVQAPPLRPGNALNFDGTDDAADLGDQLDLRGRGFTVEFWVRRTTSGQRRYLVSQGDSGANRHLSIGFTASDQIYFEYDNSGAALVSPAYAADVNTWVHVACSFDLNTGKRMIFRDGRLVASDTQPAPYAGSGHMWIGFDGTTAGPFRGDLDEVRFWGVAKSAFAIARDRAKRLLGDEDGLLRLLRFDEASGNVAEDSSSLSQPGTLLGNVARIVSTAPTGMPPRFVTLVENNDAGLGSLPVTLHIIRVDDGPFLGDLKPILPANAFDERLTLRHSSDFGADPDPVEFEWYYHPDGDGFDRLDPNQLPVVSENGSIGNANGWIRYTGGNGLNDITLGDSAESGLFAITDNFWICRYRGYNVGLNDSDVWSDWVGDPSGKTFPIPLLGEGWVKRVIRSLNPLDQRTKDFHAAAVNTYSSMLGQAGQRYEGPIAFNPDPEAINSIGLIEAYSTVLDRARSKSIDGTPQVNYNPANNALLLAASKISDLYMLLANEAYADAQDPTIGFGTSSGEYGSLASSIFAFQNQMDSLIDEELSLLRGRDDGAAGVQAPPVYNRLFWNFTLGEGQVAYVQAYNISDQDHDGFFTEKDARILYPQGHGDAWGHYLTALTGYYGLLQHPYFTWVPRAETVNVAGVGVEVDFLDERKFAHAAASRAKAGAEIVNLTYRRNYVDDPAGQWQGYKDTDPERQWGVSEWASRAGQGAYFDWLVGNAILPATDPNPSHTGIQKIDRTTVHELIEIADQARAVQATLDQADQGLNPVGLAKGAVPFDIDPTFLEVGSTAQIGRRAVQGLTQFDQILERAIGALKNSVNVWDQANRATELMRRNQDSQTEFAANVVDQERDYRNRLIEIFGYPYAGDIGPGKTYPSGYDGPDLYHFMYVDTTAINTSQAPITETFMGYFKPIEGSDGKFYYTFGGDAQVEDPAILEDETLPVVYPLATTEFGFVAPGEWGRRRAPGELQMALSDCVQANATLLDAIQNYSGLMADIQGAVELLEAQRALNKENIGILEKQKDRIVSLNLALGIGKAVELAGRRIAQGIRDNADDLLDGIPKNVTVFGGDILSAVRSVGKIIAGNVALVSDIAADVSELAQTGYELSKEEIGLSTDIKLETEAGEFEVLQQVKELEHMMRDEYNLRIRVYQEAEVVRQNLGRFHASLAAGERLIEERLAFRRRTAAATSQARYQDMTFRIFRNDAIQKYRAAFDLAARYVYLAANAYDFEVNFGADDPRAASRFLTDIVRQRSLGQLVDGNPAVGQPGLADSLARLEANWGVLKTQFGIIQPQIADTRFSLREELFRVSGEETEEATGNWKQMLTDARVDDLWAIPEFRRYCRPFAPESAGAQPGIVIRFPTKIEFGVNYFGWPLSGGDTAYDPTQYSTKIARAGVWLSGSDGTRISQTPRIYLVPVGLDVLRTPTGSDLATREFRLVDQVIPPPFPIGASDLKNPSWIPMFDTLGGNFTQVRRYGAMPARHDAGVYAEADLTNDTRLIGRSAWNTDWMLIIPGGTLLADPNKGLDEFIDSVSDIKLYFQTYSYSGL